MLLEYSKFIKIQANENNFTLYFMVFFSFNHCIYGWLPAK
jgi:hypothetical protein